MSERIRAFVALPAPQPLREALVLTRDRILAHAPTGRAAPRPAKPDQLHLTLKFLGDVAPGQVEYLRAEVTEAAAEAAPIDARVTGVTAFPGPGRARVIVAALDDLNGALAALARRISRAAISVGVPEEQREFRPHLTLARLKNPANARAWLEVDPTPHAPCQFDRLVLFQSVLKPSGPTYRVIEQAEL